VQVAKLTSDASDVSDDLVEDDLVDTARMDPQVRARSMEDLFWPGETWTSSTAELLRTECRQV
jgi:hypothetical protein